MAAKATDALEFSTFSSAINLFDQKGRDIESLEILTATTGATITVITKGSVETNRVYHVAQGDKIALCIRHIVSVSNVTLVRANWGDS